PASAQDAPHASFVTNPSPAIGEERLVVQFLDRSTGTLTSWHWNLGDGSSSNEQNPTHVYGLLGNYDVSLTVNGPAGSATFTLDSAVEIEGTPPMALGTIAVPLPDQLRDTVRH